MSLIFDNPVQPVLEMPANLTQWQHGISMSDPASRWRLYLHQVGLATLMPWFQEEFDCDVWPWPHAAPYDIWHVVDGLALQLGNSRLVIMLSETIDATELTVPREWVEIPGWTADYYIAAHINMDEQQLVLWGYTTHAQLKTAATYHKHDHTYCLDSSHLVQDFSAFWVIQQAHLPTVASTDMLTNLSDAQAQKIIGDLAQAPEPRLASDFSKWGAILANEPWRQELYQQRQNLPVQVDDWLNKIFEQGWQPAKTLLPLTSSLKFRSAANGMAVLTCGKKICLNTLAEELLLMFSVDIEANQRRNIRIQLYPSSEDLLPRDVVLALELSETGKLLKTVQAGAHDNYIQIPPFRCSAGQHLRVHIRLDNSICQEDFIS